MAIPQLSPAERQAALEKAKAARIKRAKVRDDLKSGKQDYICGISELFDQQQGAEMARRAGR